MDAVLSQYILSYGGAAGLTLLLVMLGLLVPKRFHDRELAARDALIDAEREKNGKLAQANDRLQAAMDIDRATIDRLQSSGQLTNQLVGALITIAGENRPPGGVPPHPPPPAVTSGGGP